ncbi:MAG: hypothetical protein GY827_09495 [Cytophagales bacterium]|nr:hypothetical protein [Cytophagales bacterium]
MRIDISYKLNYHKLTPSTVIKAITTKYKHLKIEKYGDSERKMKKIETEKDLLAHWEYYTSILVKGKNKLFLSFDTSRYGQVYGGGVIDIAQKKIEEVIQDVHLLLNILNEEGAVLFARIISEEIHKEKHEVITHFKSGGRSIGWKGTSIHDFMEYLPGLGYYTFLGQDYLTTLPPTKFKNLQEVNYLPTTNSSIAFQVRQTFQETTAEDIEQLEEKIDPLLFFSKNRELSTTSHPTDFKELLLKIEEEFERLFP